MRLALALILAALVLGAPQPSPDADQLPDDFQVAPKAVHRPPEDAPATPEIGEQLSRAEKLQRLGQQQFPEVVNQQAAQDEAAADEPVLENVGEALVRTRAPQEVERQKRAQEAHAGQRQAGRHRKPGEKDSGGVSSRGNIPLDLAIQDDDDADSPEDNQATEAQDGDNGYGDQVYDYYYDGWVDGDKQDAQRGDAQAVGLEADNDAGQGQGAHGVVDNSSQQPNDPPGDDPPLDYDIAEQGLFDENGDNGGGGGIGGDADDTPDGYYQDEEDDYYYSAYYPDSPPDDGRGFAVVGGGDDDTPAPTTPPEKQEFQDKAGADKNVWSKFANLKNLLQQNLANKGNLQDFNQQLSGMLEKAEQAGLSKENAQRVVDAVADDKPLDGDDVARLGHKIAQEAAKRQRDDDTEQASKGPRADVRAARDKLLDKLRKTPTDQDSVTPVKWWHYAGVIGFCVMLVGVFVYLRSRPKDPLLPL